MLILPVAGITHLQCHKTPPSHHRIPHLRSACRRRSHCRRRCHRCRCFPRERCFLKHRGRETKPSDKSFQTQPVTELQISCVYHSRKYNRRMLFFLFCHHVKSRLHCQCHQDLFFYSRQLDSQLHFCHLVNLYCFASSTRRHFPIVMFKRKRKRNKQK